MLTLQEDKQLYAGNFSSAASSSLCVIVLFFQLFVVLFVVLLWWDLLHGPKQIPDLPPASLWCQGVHSPGRFKEDCCTVTLHRHQYVSIFKAGAAPGAGVCQ